MTQTPDDWPAAWRRRIAREQSRTTTEIRGRVVSRIRYGDEPELQGMDLKPQCHDCACDLGQIHVFTCLAERCPVCADQFACCGCINAPEATQ